MTGWAEVRGYQEHPHDPEDLGDAGVRVIGETTQLEKHDVANHGEAATDDRLDAQ